MQNVFDNFHKELFEALEMALVVNDMDGNFIYINKKFEELVGYTKEEVYRLSYWDITPKAYDKKEEEQLDSLHKFRKYGPYDKEYRHKMGYLIPVRLNGKIINLNGQDYIWSSIEDISFSKSKETQAELEAKSKIVDESMNEIYIFDYQELKFIYANKSALKNIQYELSELEFMHPYDIKPSIDRKNFSLIINPLKARKKDFVRLETTHQRKDGSIYDVDIKIQLGYYMGNEVFIAYISDISETKERERKLNLTLRAYPKTSACLNAIIAKAKWHKAS